MLLMAMRREKVGGPVMNQYLQNDKNMKRQWILINSITE
jgi:hypothetical protein